MADIRIKDLPETLDVGAGDYVAVDNAGEGTRKFTLQQLVASVGASVSDIRDDISDLDTRVTTLENEGGGGGSGLTDDIKTALLQIAQKVAYIDVHGQDYYNDLYDALYNDTTRSVLLVLSHASSSNTQSTVEVGGSYTTTLTASTNYTLNSVSVTMGGVDITSTAYSSGTVSISSVTGNIVITATAVLAAQSITATYTQSGTVYDTDSLDSLKADLVVTANYSGGTSETVPSSDYTLSGTLTEGTSTVTVSYAGLTDTFSVTVTSSRPSNPYITDNMTLWLDGIFNTATGHDASATTWTNLITNDLFTNTGVTVGTDGMIFSGTQATGFVGTKPSNPATLEIVMSATDPSVTQGVIGGYSNGAGNLNIKSDALLEKRGNYQSSANAITMESGVHTYTFVDGAARYLDGESVSAASTNISMTGSGDKITIGCAYGANDTLGGYPFTGTIKCIRFYSDALTAQEVASNFAIDATRFGIS